MKAPSSLRQFVLSEIGRLARARDGQPPGEILFGAETGITSARWRKYWPRWSAAVREAGFQPNEPLPRLLDDEVMASLATIVRHHGRLPTEAEITNFRMSDPSVPGRTTLRRRFPRKIDLVKALADWVAHDAERADVAAMLPELGDLSASPASSGQERLGFVYLFKCGPDYKIGRTGHLERRFKAIGVAMPERLELVHSIRTDDSVGIEAYWHRRFAEKRRNGEWFRLRSQDVAAFRRRQFQ
jgi:hypothetical protein